MRTREQSDDAMVTLSDLDEIELRILKRMREISIGDHAGMFRGSGFDFVGLRDWQAGDRLSSIDWAQSTLTNFSPLVVRELDQPSTATVIALADASLSTRCGGLDGVPLAAAVARAIGTIGISAVLFQDSFGLITFDDGFQHLAAIRPRIGKNQVIHCLDAYQHHDGLQDVKPSDRLSTQIDGLLRAPALIPVISDFLFDNAKDILDELSELSSVHDVFLVLIDSAQAFEMPPLSSGWVEAFDVETGRSRVVSRATLHKLAARARAWQESIEGLAKAADLDVLRVSLVELESAVALSEFVAERRLRRV